VIFIFLEFQRRRQLSRFSEKGSLTIRGEAWIVLNRAGEFMLPAQKQKYDADTEAVKTEAGRTMLIIDEGLEG
jgi:hypothetical protein